MHAVCSTFPGGDQCGEPLCSTLRVTIDGDVYATAAYTTSSTSTPITGLQDSDCQATLIWGNLDTGGCTPAISRMPAPGLRNGTQPQPQQYQEFDNNAVGSLYDVSTANYGGYRDGAAANYYAATAVVISGSITSQSGQKHGCYAEGTVEVSKSMDLCKGFGAG